MRGLRLVALSVWLLSITTPAFATHIFGPVYPAPGGNGFSVISGSNAGNVGGITVEYNGFSIPGGISELYWGPDAGFPPTASLDGSPDTLTFSGISGTTATWAGTTSWTNPDDLVFYPSVPVELRITLSGLGGAPWVLSTSIPDLDPGPGAGTGAVTINLAPGGPTYQANLAVLANVGAGFVALNSINNGGGQTTNSFTGGFYAPEPASALLMGAGLIALAMRRRSQ
jgi:hypothetical protein